MTSSCAPGICVRRYVWTIFAGIDWMSVVNDVGVWTVGGGNIKALASLLDSGCREGDIWEAGSWIERPESVGGGEPPAVYAPCIEGDGVRS